MNKGYTAFIPMRGGSKGIKQKNIKVVAGRPLCHWLLDEIQKCEMISSVIVSTDCDQIAACVKAFSVKIKVLKRPLYLATDSARADDSLLYHLEKEGKLFTENIVFLQATSPLIEVSSLSRAIKSFELNDWDSLFSASRIYQFLWNENGTPMNYNPAARPNRQEHGGQLFETGGFYIFRKQGFVKNVTRLFGKIGYEEVDHYTTLEVDHNIDLILVEALLKRKSCLMQGRE